VVQALPELVRHRVPGPLRGAVAGVVGIVEDAPMSRHRTQPAGTLLPLVISYDAPLHVAGHDRQSFVAGFMPRPVATAFAGRHAAVQVYLTPFGVRRLLGVPGSALAQQVVDVAEIAPGLAVLPERLADARDWTERFSLVDDALLALAADAPADDPLVAWAWQRLEASGGRLRVGDLAARSGWSVRHLSGRFRDVVGVAPKLAAGVIRFERASRDLGRLTPAEVAGRHGFADQSHLHRDVVRFAGETPAELARARRPTAHTALGADPRE
jgi:AraC-like DNA-binding protein